MQFRRTAVPRKTAGNEQRCAWSASQKVIDIQSGSLHGEPDAFYEAFDI
jgi:hypothetical protein